MDEVRVRVSGERFWATYRAGGEEEEVRALAEAIRMEQTVEFPRELLPPGNIERDVVGSIERFEREGDGSFRFTIAFPVEDTGFELPQMLNVLWGNVSLMPRVELYRVELSPSLADRFPGPRFGRAGLRDRLGVWDRPLLCTALKPMGLDADALANYARDFALGGIDLIKDDHGLCNQPFAPFRSRVERCAAAVAEANARTGRTALYMPNVSAPIDEVVERAHWARSVGAGGLLISPGLTGFDAMRRLAADAALDLPIMSHPAFLGSHISRAGQGVALAVLFGQLMRMAGADAVIFPNHGGRFSLSPEECRTIADGTGEKMGGYRRAFPVPGGGMTLERVPEMLTFYGQDVVLLIGGGLVAHSSDVKESSRRFLELVGG